MSKYKTPAGKTIEVYLCPQMAVRKIKLKEGGKLPVELSGIFTSEQLAYLAIETYLKKNAQKQEKKVEVKKEEKPKLEEE